MDRATVTEQVLGTMPAPVASTARRVLTSPVLKSCLTPAQLAAVLAPSHARLDEAAVQLLVIVLARVGAVICTVGLRVPPPPPDEIDELTMSILRSSLHDRELGRPLLVGSAPLVRLWINRADAWREAGDERNAVMATACALLTPAPNSALQASAWPGTDRLDLTIGAAGGFRLLPSVRPALRRAVLDNLRL